MRRDKQLLVLAIAGAIGIGCWTKVLSVPAMGTQIDDVGVATFMLRMQTEITPEVMRASLERPGYRGPMAAILRVASRLGAAPILARTTASLAVVTRSTYAPAQFLLMGTLLHPGLSYQQVIVRGRLLPALFAMVAPISIALIALGIGGPSPMVRSLVATTLLACSWELTFHAAQMDPYALGLLAVVIMIGMLLSRASTMPGTRGALLEGAALSVLPWTNYQMLFLLPAYAIARAWQLRGGGARWQELLRSAVLIGGPAVISVALLYHYFLFRNAGLGVAWNAGPHGEYLFTLPHASIWTQLEYVVRFFTKNTALVVLAMTAFVPESSRWATPIGLVIIALVAVGIWRMWSAGTPRGRTLVVFAIVAALTWTAMVLVDALTLSPTRHLMLFLPLFALFAAESVAWVAARSRLDVVVGITAFGLIAVPHLATFGHELDGRRNLMSEAGISALVARTRPDLIISYNCTSDLLAMRPFSAPLFDRGCSPLPGYGYLRDSLSAAEPVRLLLINATAPFGASDFPAVTSDLHAVTHRRVITHGLNDYDQTMEWRVDRPAALGWSSRAGLGAGGYFATLLVLRGGAGTIP